MSSLVTKYIGLLSFHIFLPVSPLDPGGKPAAKVTQLKAYLNDISSRLAAKRMESGLSTGSFSPDNLDVTLLIDDASNAYRKMTNQEKKKVERSSNAPPLFELFREVTHFLEQWQASKKFYALWIASGILKQKLMSTKLRGTMSRIGKSQWTHFQDNYL